MRKEGGEMRGGDMREKVMGGERSKAIWKY